MKLTMAPIAARITVLKISSDARFGTMLKSVPEIVPTVIEILLLITCGV